MDPPLDHPEWSAAAHLAVGKVKLEVKEFIEHFLTGVKALDEHRKRGCAGLPEVYAKKKSICASLGLARCRILSHFTPLDELLAGDAAGGSGVDVRRSQGEILSIIRREHLRVRRDVGWVRSAPVVALQGFSALPQEAAKLRDLVLGAGGAFSVAVSRNTVTHVVAAAAGAGKLDALVEWGIPVVSAAWVEASAAEGRFVDHTSFLFAPVQQQQPPARGDTVAAAGSGTPEQRRQQQAQKQQRQEQDSDAFLQSVEQLFDHGGSGSGSGTGGGGGGGGADDGGFAAAAAAATTAAEQSPLLTLCGSLDNPLAAAAADSQLGRPSTGALRRGRVSRRDILGAADGASDAGERDGSAVPLAKRRRAVAPGTANSSEAGDPAGADPAAERLPSPTGGAGGSGGGAGGAGRPQGVESQMVRWDASGSASAPTTQKLRQRAPVRTFQMAGGSAVSKDTRDELSRKIKYLGGGLEVVPKYVQRASHLLMLCDQPQLTEKYLSFVASGKWIVHERYIVDSYEAGHWLEEKAYCVNGPDGSIAFHRGSMGGAFAKWKVVLLLEPGGVQVILKAGGCAAVWTELTAENAGEVTHILSDAPAKEVALAAPEGVSPETLARIGGCAYSIEILHRLLCVNPDEDAAREGCRVPLTFT